MIWLVLFFLSARSFSYGADSAWYELARQGLSEDPAQAARAWSALREDNDLERKVLEGLHSEHRLEALEIIHAFRFTSTFSELFGDLKNGKDDPLAWTTAISIADPQNKSKLGKLLSQKIEHDWEHFSVSTKRGLLAASLELKFPIPPQRITAILSDPNYEVRADSARLAGELLRTGNRSYIEPLKKALKLNPYQLRIEALNQIRKQSTHTRSQFQSDLITCTSDLNSEVQTLCRKQSQESSS